MALTTQPFAQSRELDDVRAGIDNNVQTAERIGSVAAGVGLVAYGVSRRSLTGLLLAVFGGALIRRGATGHCGVYQKLGINSKGLNTEAGVPDGKGIKVVKTVTVDRPPSEVYRFWRKLENLPRFLEHVESVRELDPSRSHWVVKGPAGSQVEWTAQIINDRAGEMISWESIPGAEVQNAGSVWFESARDGAGTDVKVSLQYAPPAGVIGVAVAKLFGEAPDQQLDDDLVRFKNLVEREARPGGVGAQPIH